MFKKISDPECSKKFRTRLFGKLSTRIVPKIFDLKSSQEIRPRMIEKFSAQVRKIFEPKCSNNFRPKMIGKFPTRIVRKQIFEKKIDPVCSKKYQPEMFEKISTHNVPKIF